MTVSMVASQKAFDLIMDVEGDVLQSYQDQGGVWTIGYGHTGPDVTPNLVITQNDAIDLLQQDIVHKAEFPINTLVSRQLNQNQFDALCSFVFNIGAENFMHSTMLSLINDGFFISAAAQFPRWTYVKGVQNLGLAHRRTKEMTLFTEPI